MKMPRHVAIILDGNGRWAKAKGMPRNYGHVQGAKTVETICEEAYRMGIQYLTVYAFSTENWSRPKEEVDALMDLQYSIVQQQNQAMLGKTLEVLVEGYDRYASSYYGRSYMDAPDIDTKIFFTSPSPVKAGSFVTVRVEDVIDYDLLGVIEQPEGSGV